MLTRMILYAKTYLVKEQNVPNISTGVFIMISKKKIAAIVDKDFILRLNKVHKQFVVKNKSELIRILLDEAMKFRGI